MVKTHNDLKHSRIETIHSVRSWKKTDLLLFKVSFIFFVLQIIPLDWKFYRLVSSIDWLNVHVCDLFYFAKYTPQFTLTYANPSTIGMQTLSDLLIVFILALAGGVVWTFLFKGRDEYNDLYYLLRVIARYRLALGIASYGFIKLFPMQQPYPSLSLLNTNYGDLSDWKIVALTYGVAPSFQSFLGAIEVLTAILLLHRKTASIGAAIIIGFTGNVFLSNLAYNGGEAVYCFYLLCLASVILFYDVHRYYNLLVLERPTRPNTYRPLFFSGWKAARRIVLKSVFVLTAFLLYGYISYAAYKKGLYQYPTSGGIKGIEGLYNVSEFKINNKTLPYSLTDSVRWQNVVFEKWPTISIQTNNEINSVDANTEDIFKFDYEKNFEYTGSIGRSFYHYDVDSDDKLLYLQNKNPHYEKDRLLLHYEIVGNRVVLEGVNETQDSLYIVLEKLPKIYLLDESVKIPQNRSVFE